MSQKFLDQLLADVYDTAHDDATGSLRLSAITTVLLQRLEDAGVLTTPQTAYYRFERGNVAAEVHGYALDSEDDVITLFFCIDATSPSPLGQPVESVPTPKDQLDRGFRRLEAFVKLAQSGRMEDIEESQPAHELAEMIREAEENHHQIELFVITTGVVSDRAASAGAKGSLRREIWDLVRLDRICGDAGDGAINIDFVKEFRAPLPCLVMSQSPDALRVLLTSIPGPVLADIYNTHRTSLLERNVRSFLQFTGKVNKGIRATLLSEPHRFLPYNNGLSATCGTVELEQHADGLGLLKAVHDFQIVNGGQTTASIASCARRDQADLSAVTVPMKLTIVPPTLLDGLVPQISRYANTQNRIQDSDFSANDPWHIAMERLSRATWTRPTPEAPRGTRWFYERSRGQYADGLAACQTQAGRRQYRIENPPAQKFTKTDLAKFLLSWDQMPATVSRGAQKCFLAFMAQLGSTARTTPDESAFRRTVALAILFHTAERLYGDLGFQGFRANVVTYSLARLSHACRKQLDVDEIWKRQAAPDELVNALKYIITGVREVIVNPPPSQRNVTEWSKRDECWTATLTRPMDIPLAVLDAPVNGQSTPPSTPESATPEEQELIEATASVPAAVWFAVSGWAAQTSSLQAWQRKIAYSLGTLAGRARPPSVKQARQGRKLLLEANRVGFTHEELAASVIDRLRCVPDST